MHQPDSNPASHRRRRSLTIVGLAASLALALYLHRSNWWPAPLALAMAHALVAISGALVIRHLTGHQRGDAPHDHQPHTPEAGGGTLVRRATAYDWVVRTILLGGERRLRTRIVELAAIQPGSAVLDVGCGTGSQLLIAANRTGPTGLLKGVEPSPEMLARARDKLAPLSARGIEVGLTQGSADALPFPDGSFDAVLCTMVLHHLPPATRLGALAEMQRVLRPGGSIVIADLETRSPGSAFSLVALLHGVGPSDAPSLLDDTASLLQDSGLDVIRARTSSRAIGCLVATSPRT